MSDSYIFQLLVLSSILQIKACNVRQSVKKVLQHQHTSKNDFSKETNSLNNSGINNANGLVLPKTFWRLCWSRKSELWRSQELLNSCLHTVHAGFKWIFLKKLQNLLIFWIALTPRFVHDFQIFARHSSVRFRSNWNCNAELINVRRNMFVMNLHGKILSDVQYMVQGG